MIKEDSKGSTKHLVTGLAAASLLIPTTAYLISNSLESSRIAESAKLIPGNPLNNLNYYGLASASLPQHNQGYTFANDISALINNFNSLCIEIKNTLADGKLNDQESSKVYKLAKELQHEYISALSLFNTNWIDKHPDAINYATQVDVLSPVFAEIIAERQQSSNLLSRIKAAVPPLENPINQLTTMGYNFVGIPNITELKLFSEKKEIDFDLTPGSAAQPFSKERLLAIQHGSALKVSKFTSEWLLLCADSAKNISIDSPGIPNIEYVDKFARDATIALAGLNTLHKIVELEDKNTFALLQRQ
jgi:hypothetical protein